MNALEINAAEQLCKKRLKNHCCSRAIMELNFEEMGREHEEFTKSMTNACNSIGKGNICGTLAAAIAILHVTDSHSASGKWQEELMDWFLAEYGGYDCMDIVSGNPLEIIRLCPQMIEKTYEKVREYIL